MNHLKEIFDQNFKKAMIVNNPERFKRRYKTLYNEVIIPTLEFSYNETQSWKNQFLALEKYSLTVAPEIASTEKALEIWKNEFLQRFGTDNISDVMKKIDKLQENNESYRKLARRYLSEQSNNQLNQITK